MATKAHATHRTSDEIADEQRKKDDADRAAGKTPITGLQKDSKHVATVQRIKALTATLRDPDRTHEQDIAVADQIDRELGNL